MALGHHTCVVCKKRSPETDLSYTLALSMSGWRETRVDDGNGGKKGEWRCPQCWAAHKRETRAKTQFNLPAISSLETTKRKAE